jgi:4-amino-4-deoxy-L-arabinose transferase-like glycosyltransferase
MATHLDGVSVAPESRAVVQPSRLQWQGPAALFACIAAVIALMAWAYRLLVVTPWLPLWDESSYYPTALRLLHHLRALDFHALGRETMRYHLAGAYPFLGPYFLVFGMAIGGATLEVARATSLVAGLVGWAGIVWLAAELAGARRAWAAAIAGALWGTSPMFLFYASRAYYESFSLMLTAYCFIAAARFAKTGSRAAALATGLLASTAFLTKVNVGAFITASLFLGLAWPEIRRHLVVDPRGLLDRITRPWILLVAAAVVPVVAWLMVSGIRQLLRILRGDPFNPLNLRDQLLYVPRSLFHEYVSYPVLAVLILAGLAYWAVKAWPEPAVRVVWLYSALNLFAEMLHTTKDGRFIWGAVGVATALTGAAVVRTVPAWPRLARALAAALLAAGLAGSVWAAPGAEQRFLASGARVAATLPQQKALVRGLEFIRQNTMHGHPILVAGIADLGIHLGMIRQFMMDPVSGQEPDVETLPYPGFDATWGKSAQPSPLYAQLLQRAIDEKPDASVVILDHAPDSPYRGRLYPWVLAWMDQYGPAAAQSNDLQAVARLDTGAGLKVTIYRRVAPGARQDFAHGSPGSLRDNR